MPRRRRLLLVVGTMALLGVAGLILFLWPTSPAPTTGITRDNFRLLRKGMSVKDVTALLGEAHEVHGWENVWRGGEITIWLTLVDQRLWRGMANAPGAPTDEAEGLRTDESLLDRIRRWLNRPVSPANSDIADYNEEGPYITFAIAAGVLALLVWLYLKRRKLPSSPK